MALDPRTVRAPEFPRVEWLNSPDPLIMADFRGRTVLVDLWDFTCINCLRTLPYLRDWHERYQAAGLIIIGVHTPEFAFGRSASLVRSALGRLGVRWPVALDNDQEIWTAYANHAWPTAYLVDADGYLRARHPGDAGYHRLEADLRQLLAGREAAREPLPPIAEGSAADDETAGVCLPSTPELQADALGNGVVSTQEARTFTLPERMDEGRLYLDGDWVAREEGLSLVSAGGSIALPLRAGAVYAVLAASADPEAPRPSDAPIAVVMLDGRPVPPAHFGSDLYLRGETTSVRIEEPRLYALLNDLPPGDHRLLLHITSPGVTVYAFSFGSCVIPATQTRSETC